MSATLPLSRVMRVRRHQPTRLEGFVDASFAFAVTLVVISIGHVPGSVAEMLTALRGLPTFAVCFLLIARIWLSHHDWSRHYDLEDTTSIGLSLALVFVVLVYVYPLRMLIAQMFLGWSDGWLADGSVTELNTYVELRAAYIVFGLGLGAISLVFVLLFRHAERRAAYIGLASDEILFTRMKSQLWSGQLLVALISVCLAAWMPITGTWSLSVPGLIYFVNIGIGRFLRVRCRLAMTQLPSPTA